MAQAYAEIAMRIAERVESGAYTPGSRLPSQRELSEEFQVSRPTIREALAALELRSIVETHVGSGTFVRHGDVRNGQLIPRWPVDASPLELLETRLLIEPHVARTAATRWRRQSLAAIARPIQGLERAAVRGSTTYDSELDRRFHAAITAATDNTVLDELMAPLWDLMAQALWKTLSQSSWNAEDTAKEAADHRAIYEAIRVRDGDAAAFHMEVHLRHVQSLLLRENNDTESAVAPRQ